MSVKIQVTMRPSHRLPDVYQGEDGKWLAISGNIILGAFEDDLEARMALDEHFYRRRELDKLHFKVSRRVFNLSNVFDR